MQIISARFSAGLKKSRLLNFGEEKKGKPRTSCQSGGRQFRSGIDFCKHRSNLDAHFPELGFGKVDLFLGCPLELVADFRKSFAENLEVFQDLCPKVFTGILRFLNAGNLVSHLTFCFTGFGE